MADEVTRTSRDILVGAVTALGYNTALWASLARAMTAIQCAPIYFRERLPQAKNSIDRQRIVKLIDETQGAIDFLHSPGEFNGRKLLYGHSLISVWATFEAFVEDFFDACAKELHALASLREGDDIGGGAVIRYRDAIREASKKAKTLGTLLAGAYARINIGPAISSESDRSLAWGNEARNCLLHRGGKWDAKACSKLSLDDSLIGKDVDVTQERFLSCYDAISAVVAAIPLPTQVTRS